MATVYNTSFFNFQKLNSYVSAKEVFEILYQYYQPKSVIDIGCGVGPWLKALTENYGVEDIWGVDGNYVKKEQLVIDPAYFESFDLVNQYHPKKKYDLALSLEVGEHLPETSADGLVRSLTECSDVVLFSAALIGQGGTYHINEQMPEYWAQKFKKLGYVPIDFIRKHVWNNEKIDWWYRQNILLFVKKEKLAESDPALTKFAENTDADFLTRVHPALLAYVNKKYEEVVPIAGYIKHKLYLLKLQLRKS